MAKVIYTHIYEKDGGFFFWDETGAHSFGPYPTQEKAEQEYLSYCKYLNHTEECDQ